MQDTIYLIMKTEFTAQDTEQDSVVGYCFDQEEATDYCKLLLQKNKTTLYWVDTCLAIEDVVATLSDFPIPTQIVGPTQDK